MQIFQISTAVAFLAALAQAVPAPASTPVTDILLFTAAAASYTLSIPCDNQEHTISNNLSVDHIQNQGTCRCEVKGINGSDVTINPGQIIVVGPPQTQVSVRCWVV